MPQSERIAPAHRSTAGGHARAITLEVIFLLVIPTLLFTLGTLPALWRYSVMQAALVVVIVLCIKRRIPLARLGICRDTFRPALRSLFPGTLAVSLIVAIAYYWGRGTSVAVGHIWWNTGFFVYYWLVAIASQQFAFIGYGVDRFRALRLSPRTVSAIVGVLFSFLHSHHVSPQLWIATFFLGAYWAWQYQKTPNLFAVMLSHAIIGTVTIMLGFV